jgi:hypothetical protein
MTPSFLTSAAAPAAGVLLKARHGCLEALRTACLDTAENMSTEVEETEEKGALRSLQDM